MQQYMGDQGLRYSMGKSPQEIQKEGTHVVCLLHKHAALWQACSAASSAQRACHTTAATTPSSRPCLARPPTTLLRRCVAITSDNTIHCLCSNADVHSCCQPCKASSTDAFSACCCADSQALKEEARKAAYKIKDPEAAALHTLIQCGRKVFTSVANCSVAHCTSALAAASDNQLTETDHALLCNMSKFWLNKYGHPRFFPAYIDKSGEENPETAVGTAGEIVDVSKTADNLPDNTADAATAVAAKAATATTAHSTVSAAAATQSATLLHVHRVHAAFSTFIRIQLVMTTEGKSVKVGKASSSFAFMPNKQPASPPAQRVPQVSPMPKITPVLKSFGGGKPKDQAAAEAHGCSCAGMVSAHVQAHHMCSLEKTSALSVASSTVQAVAILHKIMLIFTAQQEQKQCPQQLRQLLRLLLPPRLLLECSGACNVLAAAAHCSSLYAQAPHDQLRTADFAR
eukprot:6377-Heterococcus_DN1.PRE.2